MLTSLLTSLRYINTKQEWCSWEDTTEEDTAVQKNIAACLSFVKVHLDIPQSYWQNILCTDKTTVELFGRNTQNYGWRKKGTAHQHKNLIPNVKNGGGSIMVWGCFAASVYQDILQEKVRLPVCQLKLHRSWVMQQDNDPKHRSISTKEWLQQKIIRLLEWPSQSPNLNPIWDAVAWPQESSSGQTSQEYCWTETVLERGMVQNSSWPLCKLNPHYRKHLVEVIAAKGGLTNY